LWRFYGGNRHVAIYFVRRLGDDEFMTGERGSRAGVYSIGAVARMLDVPAQTLRAWEDRYAQIVPSRSAGGQRLYSRDQVDHLRFVREQIDAGLQPADAHRLLAERLRRPAGAVTDSGDAGAPGGAGLSILLAERDTYAADFAEYFLRTEGYTCRIVLDSNAVEQDLQDDPPQLVVVDLMISGGDGLGLCRTIRERSSIPILAVSPLASGDAAVQAGADAFLQKPLEPLQFVSAVRDLLGTSAYLRRTGVRQ
jgi:DNA-binding transcriptional MerR regulator